MKKISTLILALVLILMIYGNALACDCSGIPVNASNEVFTKAVDYHFNKAAIVISGKVTAKLYIPIENEKDTAGSELKVEALIVKIAVDSWWKGKAKDEVILYMGKRRYSNNTSLRSSCDYNFVVGEEYLIYAFGSESYLTTDACNAKYIKDAEREIKQLKKLLIENKLLFLNSLINAPL